MIKLSWSPESLKRLQLLSKVSNNKVETRSLSYEFTIINCHQTIDKTRSDASGKNLNDAEKRPWYHVTVLFNLGNATKAISNGRYLAIFVVPIGREHEYVFSSPGGLESLCSQCGFARLAVVSVARDHGYGLPKDSQDNTSSLDLNKIQVEINDLMRDLLQPDAPSSSSIPFLTDGDSIGERESKFTCISELSGRLHVEDVLCMKEGKIRRLVFESNRNVIQSEALVLANGEIDIGYISFDYQISMIASFSFLYPLLMPKDDASKQVEVRTAIIGLGGGGMAMFLHNFFCNMNIVTIDLDKAIVEVAKNYFGFQIDDRMEAKVGDGIEFVEAYSGPGLHALLLDVDSKDSTIGMSCPPEAFVTRNFLQLCLSILCPEGMLVVNVSALDQNLYEEVRSRFFDIFASVYEIPTEDTNIVLVGLSRPRNVGISSISDSVKKLQDKITKKIESSKSKYSWDPHVNIYSRIKTARMLGGTTTHKEQTSKKKNKKKKKRR